MLRLTLIAGKGLCTRPILSLGPRISPQVRFATEDITYSFPVNWRVVPKIEAIQDGPERDLKNFPRPVQRHWADPVRLGFLPNEWFDFFYRKTGVTGPYAFMFTFGTLLVSKEYWPFEHEFYAGLSMWLLVIIFIKKFRQPVHEFFFEEVRAEVADMKLFQKTCIDHIKFDIENQRELQKCIEGEQMLFSAKKENVLLQLEAGYRERLATIHKEVKRRLDYQLELQNVERRMAQKHVVDWIVNSVKKSITPQFEKDAMNKCIADLKALASASRA